MRYKPPRKDFTGMIIEGLTVLKKVESQKQCDIFLCKCMCGNLVRMNSTQLKSKKKDCGCRINTNFKCRDWNGCKVNMLTVLNPLKKVKKKEGRLWLCKCDCGRIAEISSWQLHIGKKSCGCWQGNPVEISAVNRLYAQYKHGCFRRNRQISFTLTLDEFQELIKTPCYYCGSPPSQKMRHYRITRDKVTQKCHSECIYYLIYNGIDRVDNEKGYDKDNVVSCCRKCNHMKFDLSIKEFMEHIIKIYEHIQKGNRAGGVVAFAGTGSNRLV